MNYQEIVNRIQDITNQHKMLADFGYGDISDLKTRFENTSGNSAVQADYPYLFLNPGVHGRNQGMVTYNFNLVVMDMARDEVSDDPYNNQLAIQSQCQQYIDDVLAYLYYGYTDNPEVIYSGVSYTPFNERFQDNVAGMTATLQIQVPQPLNNCITPVAELKTLVGRWLTNVEESGNEFHQALTDDGNYVDFPQYDIQVEDLAMQFVFNGAYDYNTYRAPEVIEPENGIEYTTGGNPRLFFPAGVTGNYRIEMDLELKNVQGQNLDPDSVKLRLFRNGQGTETTIDLPHLPIDGTVVPFRWTYELEIPQPEVNMAFIWEYVDIAPIVNGPAVGYRGDVKLYEISEIGD